MKQSDTKAAKSEYKSKYHEIIIDKDNLLIVDTLLKRVLTQAQARGLSVRYVDLANACNANGCPVNDQFLRTQLLRRDSYLKNKGFREGERLYPTSIEVIIALIKAYKLDFSDFFVL